MGRVTGNLQNWSGGELSADLAGRFDLSVFYNGCEWMQNFKASVQGPSRYRDGTKFAWSTRDNQICRLVEFEYNTDQAYVLEFTDLKMRIFKDGGVVTEAPKTITGVTKANPAVVTSNAHGFANGDRVIISGVVGMTQVNNLEFIVAGVTANTFQLQGINSTGYSTYVSGGSVSRIVEVTTPYTAAQLFDFDYAQTNDTMYLVHPSYAPRKLTRSSHIAWTLNTFDISANPFGTVKTAIKTTAVTGITQANPAVVTTSVAHNLQNGDKVVINGVVGMTQVNGVVYTVAGVTATTFQLSGVNSTAFTAYASGGSVQSVPTAITAANPAVISLVGHGLVNGDIIYIEGVQGMTQLNRKTYTVRNAGANTFELEGVDSTAYNTFTAGGAISKWSSFSYPGVVTFFEQRLLYGASDSFPQRIWGSAGGLPDVFITGTGDSDSIVYNVNSGKANRIRWMVGTEDFLAVGTAGTEFKASGGGQNDAITPTNISVKPVSQYGTQKIKPIRLDSHILYIQRDAMTTRSFEFDAVQDGYTSINRNLVSNQITQGRYGMPSGVKQMAYQAGNQGINWAVRNDGILIGLTFEPKEQVNGWHRHLLGGTYLAGKQRKPEVGSVATIPQDEAADQVYMSVTRTINGKTVRYIEYFADQPMIPRFLDYFTGDKEADTEAYLQDLWEAQKRLHYVDSGVTYDGSAFATYGLTLSDASVGTGRTITAAGSSFSAAMVGREIWGKAGGRAKITGYTNATTVTVKITVAFSSTAIAAGNWYLTASSFGGLQHLAGEQVVALADGGVVENLMVDSGGNVSLGNQHSYVTIGLGYVGIWKSMDLEGGGDNGTSQTKKRSVSSVGVKFQDTLGAKFGTDIYKLERVKFRTTADKTDRPAPLFSGVKDCPVRDDWEQEKHIFCVQDKPLPCNVQLVTPNLMTNSA